MIKGLNLNFIKTNDNISADAKAEIKDIRLPDGTLAKDIKLSTAINKKQDTFSGSPDIRIKGLKFSWGGFVERLDLKTLFETDTKNITFKEIDVNSNLINFKGSAGIAGLDKKSAMGLDIKIASEEFAYEPFVNFLPVKDFPHWLNILLTKQVRKGTARIEHASLKGQVKDFNSYETCIRTLDIKLAINGQTFSSRPGNIIRNIKAGLTTNNGSIDVHNITGTAGTSTINSVTLNFPGTDKHGFRIGVTADIDMLAADFIQTWRAGVMQWV
jgi:hypothetical protein